MCNLVRDPCSSIQAAVDRFRDLNMEFRAKFLPSRFQRVRSFRCQDSSIIFAFNEESVLLPVRSISREMQMPTIIQSHPLFVHTICI